MQPKLSLSNPFSFLTIRPPPTSPLFPYTTLFRSRNRRRLKANQTGKKFRVGIKSNISTNRNNLISGVDRCIHLSTPLIRLRSEERFSRNAETDLVCRLLLEKKKGRRKSL